MGVMNKDGENGEKVTVRFNTNDTLPQKEEQDALEEAGREVLCYPDFEVIIEKSGKKCMSSTRTSLSLSHHQKKKCRLSPHSNGSTSKSSGQGRDGDDQKEHVNASTEHSAIVCPIPARVKKNGFG